MSIGKFFDTPTAQAAQARRLGTDRQGRVERPAAADLLAFEDRQGRRYALLGVTVVGEISINPAGGDFLWSCFLPGTPRMQRATGIAKAQSALNFKVREWCEAAGLVVSAAAQAKLGG
jgi:hypothetical protein